MRSLWRSFSGNISENINISRKITCFEITLKKIVFCRYLHINIRDLFEIFYFFCPCIHKYQHFKKKDVILRSLWKLLFWTYFRKYWHSFSKDDFLWSLWKKSFLFGHKWTFFCDHYIKLFFAMSSYQPSRHF